MTRRPKSAADGVGDLTSKEQANVRTALQFLRVRGGGVEKLGPVLGFKPHTLSRYCAEPLRARASPSA